MPGALLRWPQPRPGSVLCLSRSQRQVHRFGAADRPGGIPHHEQAAGGHREGGEQGIEEARHCQGDRRCVIQQRPHKILPKPPRVTPINSKASKSRSSRSPRITTSAASAARAVGAPKAIPRSAAARAGASLLPSPIMATVPSDLCCRMTAAFASGGTPAWTSSTGLRTRLDALRRSTARHGCVPAAGPRRPFHSGRDWSRLMIAPCVRPSQPT